jgi:hypothetical protein
MTGFIDALLALGRKWMEHRDDLKRSYLSAFLSNGAIIYCFCVIFQFVTPFEIVLEADCNRFLSSKNILQPS